MPDTSRDGSAVAAVEPRQVDSTISASKHILELDGFRAIAIWMVLLGHMLDGWTLPPEATAWMPRLLFQIVSHGWLGVDLFFILSGFLITGILLDERHLPRYFTNFYGRRALRILPLSLVCLAVFFLAYPKIYAPFFGLALLFSANLDILFGVPEPHGPGVYWSLAVEEHFYLLWPIAVRFLSRRGLFVLALAIFLGTPLFRAWGVWHGLRPNFEVYQFSWFRFDGLALGGLIAIWSKSRYFTRPLSWRAIALLTGTVALATLATLPYGVLGTQTIASAALRSTQAQAAFGAAIIFALAYRGEWFLAPLRSGFMKLTAKLSYCLYLIHLSLGDLYYWVLRRLEVNDLQSLGPAGALFTRSVVIIGASFLLATLSQKYLEAPFMRLRRHFTA